MPGVRMSSPKRVKNVKDKAKLKALAEIPSDPDRHKGNGKVMPGVGVEHELDVSGLSQLERKELVAKVLDLSRKGYSVQRVGLALGIPRKLVSKIKLKELKQLDVENNKARDYLVRQQCMYLEHVRFEAYEAWEKSGKDKNKTVREYGLLKDAMEGKGKKAKPIPAVLQLIRKVIIKEKGTPASEYLRIIVHTIELESKLLGLLKEGGLQITNTNMLQGNWAQMRRPRPEFTPDVVDTHLKELDARLKQMGVVDAKAS